MPCNNKKNNCCKNPFPYLVLLGSFSWSGTPSDFLDTLDHEQRIRMRLNFLKVNTEDDQWIDLVKTRLKCLCKKYGRKASIISTIFVSDNELKLAVLRPYFKKIYLTGSTESILVETFGNDYACPLPIARGDSVAIRSNNYYRISGKSISILGNTDSNSTYSTQTQSKLLEKAIGVNIVTPETFESYPDFSVHAIYFDPTKFDDPLFLNNTNKKLMLTDGAASYLVVGALERGLLPILDLSTGRISVDINELQYEAQVNYYYFPGEHPEDRIKALMTQGGINYNPVSYTLRVNNASATGEAFNMIPYDEDY